MLGWTGGLGLWKPSRSLVSQELPGYAGASRFWVGQVPKFLEVHKEPPSIMGTGLLLGGLMGIRGKIGHSLDFPSLMKRLSLSMLDCLGLEEG